MARATSITRLEALIDQEREALDDLRQALGATVENAVLLKAFEGFTKVAAKVTAIAPDKSAVSIAKFLVKRWFPNLGQFLNNFDNLPGHAKIQICAPECSAASYDWTVVEVLLYEDMCALFNCAKEMHASRSTGVGKRRGKAARALIRATFNSIIYFLEAYLNGVALDFYAENMKTISVNDKKLILEEDPIKQKRITVTLREKVLQYPRIILGVTHPPIHESNCPELALIIGTAKQIRDAIAHPSAAIRKPGEVFSEKEMWLSMPDFDDLEKNVDSAIALVRKIEATIRGDQKRLFWLRDRGSNGTFGADVFS
ncbi:MAG TPA: hypothetical protein VFP96_05320 [Candidatus Acidoferrum sp.]|nr:hypothetical protein [Candidatus Acidoferrum sp.]